MKDGCSCCSGCSSADPKPFPVAERVEYAADSIVSSTLVDTDTGTLTFFAFDAGQRLSTHSAPYDAIVQVVEGEAHITVGGVEHSVAAGQMLVMPADVPHAVEARVPFKMILTMFRGE